LCKKEGWQASSRKWCLARLEQRAVDKKTQMGRKETKWQKTTKALRM